MNGKLIVSVQSSGPRGNAEIEREIAECTTRLHALIREKVVAGLNLRVVDVEDNDGNPTIAVASDDGTPPQPALRTA